MNRTLAVVLGLLAIVLLGAAAFLFLQMGSEENDTDTTSEAQPTVEITTPTATPEPTATPTAVPIEYARPEDRPCTEEELTQIRSILTTQQEQLTPMLPDFTVDAATGVVPDVTQKLMTVNQVIDRYNEFYSAYPPCADGQFIREYLAIAYDSWLIYGILLTLEQYVAPVDEQIAGVIRGAATRRSNTIRDLKWEADWIAELPLLPQGLVNCGEVAVSRHTGRYDSIVDLYWQRYPDYEQLAATGSGDFDNLIQLEDVSRGMFSLPPEPCAESNETDWIYNYLFTDTTIAVHAAQVAAFARQSNATLAQAMDTLVNARSQLIQNNIQLLTDRNLVPQPPTPTGQ